MSATTQRRYRARIAPRSERRGWASRVHWDKVGRVALVLVLFAVIASYVRPTINLIGTWQESRAAEERLAVLESENRRLERRAAELKTPAAAVREARKLGLVGPGEQAYVVDGLRR